MDMENGLVGYQAWIEWMDAPVLTLADLWPLRPRAMVVGLNPAPTSVEVGHYYQGRSGQRQLRRLMEAGLFEPREVDGQFEETALRSGVGFTDIVKRPSRGEKDVTTVEIEHGRSALISGTAVPSGSTDHLCVSAAR
jgi:TDG/mug DNA glycosylase family protein